MLIARLYGRKRDGQKPFANRLHGVASGQAMCSGNALEMTEV